MIQMEEYVWQMPTFEGLPKLKALGIHVDLYRHPYQDWLDNLHKLAMEDEERFYDTVARYSEMDFFFFCFFVLHLPVFHPFLLARIYEAQDNRHGTIDLWAREHWKSTIKTYALAIWEAIRNPNERICIFSHTRPLAKHHLRRIKHTIELNGLFYKCWPDIFPEDVKKRALKWSEDEGLMLNRSVHYPECTFEAWGLVDAMPIGKHFSIRVYDDIITERSVFTGSQIEKATNAFKLSENLGTRGGIKRVIGTRYASRDTYADIMENDEWRVLSYPAEVDERGKFQMGDGIPVYLSREELDRKIKEQGEYIYSAQMGQNPVARSEQRFQEHFIRYFNNPELTNGLNKYIFVDPSSGKEARHDYTVMLVIGTDGLRNYWIVDMIRDRLTLGEKWDALSSLVTIHNCTTVYYEKYGMQSDIEYIKDRQEATGTFFSVLPIGGTVPKRNRIMSLHPLFRSGRIILPRAKPFTDVSGNVRDLVFEFMYDEFLLYPYSKHDDMLDCLSRILDVNAQLSFPSYIATDAGEANRVTINPFEYVENTDGMTWMSA